MDKIMGGVTTTPLAMKTIKKNITDQAYNPNSENAQSGKAVAKAVGGCVQKVSGDGLHYQVYAVTDNPYAMEDVMLTVDTDGNTDGQIPRRCNGALQTNAPLYDLDCANKKYVDDGFVQRVKGNAMTYQAYVVDPADNAVTVEIEDNTMYKAGAYNFPQCIPLRNGNGNLYSNEPIEDLDCVNKKYVDDLVGDIETLLGGI